MRIALTRATRRSRNAALTDAMHEHARAVRADLAGGIEVREQRAGHRVVELGVVEDDQRRLAAELERHVLQRRRRIAHHGFAGAHLAGERDLADVGMRVSSRPVSAKPCTTWNTPARHAGLEQDLLELDGGERRQFGRLENHGVAAGERRRGLPAGDLQRIVPGADAGDHAQRLAPRVAERLRPEIDVLAGEALRETGEIFEAIGAGDDVDDAGLLDGLAGIARLELGEFLDCATRSRSAARRSTRPRSAPVIARPAALRRCAARTAALTSVGAGGTRLAQHFAGCGIDGRECGRPRLRHSPPRCATAAVRRPSQSPCSRPSTNAVSKARALSLSASRQPESAARSHTPSIIAAIMAARLLRLVRAARAFFSELRRFDSVRRW